MLHSRVRRRLLERTGTRKWNHDEYQIPINQEDMMGTLMSFSVNVIRSIQATGAPFLTLYEQNAYLHLWRYIGHLIGVKDEYNMCSSLPRAGGAVESVVLHLLMNPNKRSQEVAQRVLASVADRKVGQMRKPWSLGMHTALARIMLGEQMGDALGLDKGNTSMNIHAMIFLFIIRILNLIWPFCVRRDTFFGRKCISKTRKILRDNVNKELYGENKSKNESISSKEDNKMPHGHGAGGGTCPFGFSNN